MKIKTSTAAQRAGLHPLNFLLAISQMVGNLSDCWPEVDAGYVDTVLALSLSHTFREPTVAPHGAGEAVRAKPEPDAFSVSVSAVRILDKLERSNKWGRKAIALDTLRNHFCKGVQDAEDALEELVESGLVLPGKGRRGPYSLNPEKKGEIDRMTRTFREQRA